MYIDILKISLAHVHKYMLYLYTSYSIEIYKQEGLA